MPKIDLFDITGKKSGQVDLPKEIFAAKVNPLLMAQAVRVYLSNRRKAKAKARNRGEVTGSTRKIWRQKGTGRARHGDRYAPIFVGGGKAHGPTGKENFNLKMSKKMCRQALFSALTTKLEKDQILILKDLKKVEPKTKKMAAVLEKIGANESSVKKGHQLTLILPEAVDNIIRAARNIKGVKLIQTNFLNTYEVLNGGKLILMEESLPVLKERFLKKTKKLATKEKKVKTKKS